MQRCIPLLPLAYVTSLINCQASLVKAAICLLRCLKLLFLNSYLLKKSLRKRLWVLRPIAALPMSCLVGMLSIHLISFDRPPYHAVSLTKYLHTLYDLKTEPIGGHHERSTHSSPPTISVLNALNADLQFKLYTNDD